MALPTRALLSGGYGIEGDVLSGTDQVGVYGYCAGATATDYAGYFQGNLYATSASSGIKAFKIDHPQDPANKYLYHSSVESNEMVNIHRAMLSPMPMAARPWTYFETSTRT